MPAGPSTSRPIIHCSLSPSTQMRWMRSANFRSPKIVVKVGAESVTNSSTAPGGVLPTPSINDQGLVHLETGKFSSSAVCRRMHDRAAPVSARVASTPARLESPPGSQDNRALINETASGSSLIRAPYRHIRSGRAAGAVASSCIFISLTWSSTVTGGATSSGTSCMAAIMAVGVSE